MSEHSARQLLDLAKELQSQGYPLSHAFELATLQHRIDAWPAAWGHDLVALLYGDFDPPSSDLRFPSLRITVEAAKREGTLLSNALTVLRAVVEVDDHSLLTVKQAMHRLNMLAGVLSFENGGAPIRWWSHILWPSVGGQHYELGSKNTNRTLTFITLLPDDLKEKVEAALFWMREPRGMILEHTRSDQLAVFAGYWNAFECLVDVANRLFPPPRLTRTEKEAAIVQRTQESGGSLSVKDISELYRDVISPGMTFRGWHAIRTCLPHNAEQLIQEAFQTRGTQIGLYALRNSINHGTVDTNDPETIMSVEARFPVLHRLVRDMLNVLLLTNAAAVITEATPPSA